MSSSNQPYQGFPYVTVPYNDAPSIDSATAQKWANLPVRPIRGVRSPLEDNGPKNKKPPRKDSIEDNPVVYIDLPSNDTSASTEPATDSTESQPTNKHDSIPATVYYNPYEEENSPATSPSDPYRQDSCFQSTTQSGSSSGTQRIPPTSLNVNMPSGSSSSWNSPTPTASYDYSSKETQVYTPAFSRPGDGFQLASVPVSEFPAPPPAYSEVAPVVVQPSPSPAPQPAPPTQVIVPVNNGPAVSPVPTNPYRQLLDCPHCGARVYSLVVIQNGPITHAIAIVLLLFCLLPFIFLIYYLDYCKYRNHYCPNCNQLIGYEVCCHRTVYPK